MKTNKLCIVLLTMLFYVVSVHSQTFEVDGISYNVTKQPVDESPGEVEVTGGEIKEVIEFPETVVYNDVTYTVTSIRDNAFSGRRNSNNFTRKYIIPGTVRTIGNSAFYDNYYLEEVEFHEGLQTIGAAAFAYNLALKEIRLPSTLVSIESNSFYGCSSLNNIKFFVNNISEFCNNSIVRLFNASIQLLDNNGDEIKEIIIPEDVISIGESAFAKCIGLTSITIPNSVTSIGKNSFTGCSGLTSVNIGNSLTSIGESAFSGCYGLISVNLGEQLTTIGTEAFKGCSSLSFPIV